MKVPYLSVAAVALAMRPAPVRAHGGAELASGGVLWAWQFSPEIVVATAVLVLVYLRGTLGRQGAGNRRGRHVLFFSGVAAVFLSLQSPIDPMGERLFSMHQVQHFLLRMLGPMLIALSAPQGALVAGLPRGVSRSVLGPAPWSGPLRRAARLLGRAEVAFALFVAALYVWQIPPLHTAALLNDAIHYGMHATMLAAGLLFWFVILDRRDPPKGLSHQARLLMLVGVIASNIVLGALTTLKERVVYTAYDLQGRLFDVDPLMDEVTGGFVIWVPSSMMCIIALLVVMYRWGGHERKSELRRLSWSSSNSRALEWPETAEELRLKVAAPNRAVGLVLSAVSLSVFVIAMATAISIHAFT
jgi:putative membrane protein